MLSLHDIEVRRDGRRIPLDLGHRYRLMTLLRAPDRDAGRTMAAIPHDVHLAIRFANRTVARKGGRCFFDGSPAQLRLAEPPSHTAHIAVAL